MRELLKKMQADSADLLGERRLGETWTVGRRVHGYCGTRGARSSTTASSSDESDMSVSASSGTESELGSRGRYAGRATSGLIATHGMDTSGRAYHPLAHVLRDRPGHVDVPARQVRERLGPCDREYEHTYEHARERERHVANDTFDSGYFSENELNGESSRRPIRHAVFTGDRGMVWPDRVTPDDSNTNARYRPRRGNEHHGLGSPVSPRPAAGRRYPQGYDTELRNAPPSQGRGGSPSRYANRSSAREASPGVVLQNRSGRMLRAQDPDFASAAFEAAGGRSGRESGNARGGRYQPTVESGDESDEGDMMDLRGTRM
jgi:hypothetical protein